MKIEAITVRRRDTKKLVFAEGIEGGSTYVQLFMRTKGFTEEELEQILAANNFARVNGDTLTFGEHEAYTHCGVFGILEVDIIKVEVE